MVVVRFVFGFDLVFLVDSACTVGVIAKLTYNLTGSKPFVVASGDPTKRRISMHVCVASSTPALGGPVCCKRGLSLSKLDIINEVVNRTGITKTKAEIAAETVFETMLRALAHGEHIELREFGNLIGRPRKVRTGRPLPTVPKLPYKSKLNQQKLRRVIAEIAAEESRRSNQAHGKTRQLSFHKLPLRCKLNLCGVRGHH